MRRVAITGMGAVCGAGAGVEALWSLLCAGGTALRSLPAGLDVGPVALVSSAGDGSVLPGDDAPRAAGLLLQAGREALAAARLRRPEASRVGVCIGTTGGEKGPWLVAQRQGRPRSALPDYGGPARALAASSGAAHVEVLSAACASGNAALGAALDLLRDGACDVVLAGGVDTLSDFVLAGFASLRAHAPAPCRPFDRRRCGLSLGEGAGVLVLEAAEHARARGAPIAAYLDGYGGACDAHHMTGPDPDGRGLARSIRAALRDGEAGTDDLDFVSLHGTATVFNDLMEARALHAALGPRAGQVPVHSIKGSIGHALGAAGALEAIVCVRALQEQRIPPTTGFAEPDPELGLQVVAGAPRSARLRRVLSTSSGFGGINAAVLLAQAVE